MCNLPKFLDFVSSFYNIKEIMVSLQGSGSEIVSFLLAVLEIVITV